MKPSERPWIYDRQDTRIYSAGNDPICVMSQTRNVSPVANAALIVRAVNSHDRMVGILRDIVAECTVDNCWASSPTIGTLDRALTLLKELGEVQK